MIEAITEQVVAIQENGKPETLKPDEQLKEQKLGFHRIIGAINEEIYYHLNDWRMGEGEGNALERVAKLIEISQRLNLPDKYGFDQILSRGEYEEELSIGYAGESGDYLTQIVVDAVVDPDPNRKIKIADYSMDEFQGDPLVEHYQDQIKQGFGWEVKNAYERKLKGKNGFRATRIPGVVLKTQVIPDKKGSHQASYTLMSERLMKIELMMRNTDYMGTAPKPSTPVVQPPAVVLPATPVTV